METFNGLTITEGIDPKNSSETEAEAGSTTSTCESADASGKSGDQCARSLEQRQWRIHELVESEKDYVSDLAQCCQYIYYMRQSKEEESPDIPMPEDLKQGKDRMIFGNLEMIYEWHRE